MNPDDTIVAISSPPGKALRGIVRLSGPEAFQIAGQVFRSDSGDMRERRENARVPGRITLCNNELPASAFIFRNPHSYTRQDIVELHLLGSPVVLGMLVEACLQSGARRAEAGEFTARAYLAGAMDLSSVHGIAGLIAARSDQQLRAAERLLHGSLSQTAARAREELADLLSLVEGALDFADEPIEFITPQVLGARLAAVRAALNSTMSAALRTERWDRLPHIVLTGRPNAGKSSLFNRLTGMDRSICAPLAGTTRDTLAAPLMAGGMECLLIDAPGLMDNPAGLDAQAVEQARLAIKEADLILEIVDASCGASAAEIDPGDAALIRVGNKIDLLIDSREYPGLSSGAGQLTTDGTGFLARTLNPGRPRAPLNIFVSALTGEGCEQLKGLIAMTLYGRETDSHDSAIALMAEHRDALCASIEALDRGIELASQSRESLRNADLVALELHAAADALAILVGQDQTDEMLGRIFSRFCVGK
jgi:tRNA modification GTPase